MNADSDRDRRLSDLRRRAESLLRTPAEAVPELSVDEIRKLVHELQMHQIELQMQNEELRRAQSELLESHQRYTDLYDFAPVGYLSLSEKGLIAQANLTAAMMLGMERPRLSGRRFSQFLLDDDQDIWYLHRRRLVATGQPQTCELRMCGRDGESCWLRVDSTLANGADGSDGADGADGANGSDGSDGSDGANGSDHGPPEIRIALSDISQRKRMETLLQQAHDELEQRVEARTVALTVATERIFQEMKERERMEEALWKSQRLASIGTLAAGIAHEVNTPLHSISLSAGVAANIKDRPDQAETLDKMLRMIQEEALRCGRIVKSVLQFAREEETDKWPAHLDAVAHHARNFTNELAAQHGVEVRLELPDDLPLLVINPTEMEQVFVNLIANAVEASAAGGCVNVRMTHDAEAVRIRVEDAGRGMTPRQVEHVFDPFFTTRKGDGGTGLGLSVVYGIVEQHGGTITVDSVPGQGTVFTIVLPLDASATQEADHGQDTRHEP